MRGLLLRLSALDSGAESAVRIIAFFDGLTKNRASRDALVRAAAGLADCPAGMRDNAGNVLAHFDARGRPRSDAPPELGLLERAFGNSVLGGTVWLERPDGPQPLDEMVLERMAVAADIILDRRSHDGPAHDDPQLVRALIGARSRGADRIEAGRQMGIRGSIVVLAARLASDDPRRLPRLLRTLEHDLGAPVRGTVMDERAMAVVVDARCEQPLDRVLDTVLEPGDVVGVGATREPQDAQLSWRSASHALAFALARRQRIVSEDELGPIALLAALSDADLMDLPDVKALCELARSRGGTEIIASLQQLVTTGSQRQTSAAMHLHHSSVAHRVHRAESALGYLLDNPDGLFRVRLALEMWRLASSHPAWDTGEARGWRTESGFPRPIGG